ncbi:acyltransferase [Solidesulfovibrio sp.]|uniref:acyltransferase family protein n=1 Tax=Solidesulfovibrio sp. TaxID=2910990 RepID=UPI002B206548|nr:acyltransferase [Solidesulfovibrio sp.]MEA4858752.1 acyltransferase [Solidesulfovibrio sp.]
MSFFPTDSQAPLKPVREPIDADVSARIDVLRAVLIGLIVLCHGGRFLGAQVPFASPFVEWVLTMVNRGPACVAVPLFFAISGYLLLRKLEATPAAYLRLMRTKAVAIGLPFVLFNAIWIAWVFVFGSIPLFGGRSFVLAAGIPQKLLGLGTSPFNYPLWFLRDLLVVFALAPVFLVFYRRLPRAGLLLLAGLWFLESPASEYSLAGFAFAFYAGGYLARRRANLRDTAGWDAAVLPLFALGTALVGLQPWLGLDPYALAAVKKVYQMVGVAAFWCLSRRQWLKGSALLHRVAAMSFFVFLTHEPTVSLLQSRLLAVWTPAGTAGQLVAYPLVGLAAMAGLSLLGWGLSRSLPQLFAVATGAPPRLRFAPAPVPASKPGTGA